MNETLGKSATGLHRRTVLKGAAWSVPVVAAAVAVPAYAASADCAGWALVMSTAKVSGAWNYEHTFALTHNGTPVTSMSGVKITISYDKAIPGFAINSQTNGTASSQTVGGKQTIVFTGNVAASPMTLGIRYGNGNSGPGALTMTITVQVPSCPTVVAGATPTFTPVK